MSIQVDGESTEHNRLQPVGDGERRTVQEQVLEKLRNAILIGGLPGGFRLVQADLATELNVSTTPVREALRQLEVEGLVHTDAHRGGIVKKLNQVDLDHLYDLRTILEPEALRRAIPVPPELIAEAEELHEEMGHEESPARFATLNREFHLTIYRATNNPRLVAMVKSVSDPLMAYVSASLRRVPELLQRSYDDHQALLDAIKREDVEAAIGTQRKHITIPRRTLDL